MHVKQLQITYNIVDGVFALIVQFPLSISM